MSSTAVKVSHSKILDESTRSNADINNLLTSFRKKKDIRLDSYDDPSGDILTDQSLSHPLRSSRRDSHVFQSSSAHGYKALPNSASLNVGPKASNNPFLDLSDDEESGMDEEGMDCQSSNVLNLPPLSVEDSSDVQGGKKRWYQRGVTKSKLCCIVLVAIIFIAAIVVPVTLIISKKESRSDPTNPSEEPPSYPQTAPPSRLPSSMPTINIIPNWVQVGGDLAGEEPGDEAGFSMSASENGRVIIGARRNAKGGMKNRGAARIFQFDPQTGFYVPIKDIYGEEAGDQCGFSVSMSMDGKRVAVGSLGSDKNGLNSGQVRIFDENELSNTWTMVFELIGEEETSLFGASVSLSQDGSHLAVGAPYYSEGADMIRNGRAYVYRQVQESEWEQVGGSMSGTSSNDLFGWSVSFSPNAQLVAVGAPRLEESSDSGYVKVFSFETNAWDMYGESMRIGVPGDRFGFSVSLAGDNTFQRIVIGAPGMNENGEGSGLASVYENGGNNWQRSGDDLFGDGWGENFGYAVSITPDGTRFVVGVPNKKLDGVPVGQVKVVDVKSGELVSAGEIYGRDGEKFGVSVSSMGTLVYGGASGANLVRIYGDIQR
mmetsp:Transcript_18531/g.29976  ORF Transcript_18531/g.29976 Transcript_18531/m.29976 type:complete len:600 (+) Transcript_18531:43-1842(+)